MNGCDLQSARNAACMSPADLAHIIGVSSREIRKWEREGPPAEFLRPLRKALNINERPSECMNRPYKSPGGVRFGMHD